MEHWLKMGLKEKLIKEEPSKENTTRGGEGGG